MCHTFEKQTNFIELFRSWLIFLLLLVLVDHYCMKGVNGFPTNANEFHDLDNDEPYSAHNLKNWIISNVDDVVESLKQCIQFPGMSIGVIKLDGKDEDKSLTLTRNYGVMDVETNRPVNDDTRFCIGSVTKGFTAALLIQLLKENGT